MLLRKMFLIQLLFVSMMLAACPDPGDDDDSSSATTAPPGPETPTEAPETPTATTDTPTAGPDTPTEAPTTPTAAPETPTEIPAPTEIPTPTAPPPTPTDLPATSTASPATPSPAPDLETPTPTEVPDTPTPTSVPETPTPIVEPTPTATPEPVHDVDLDGYIDAAFGGDDCDDSNPSTYPGADEYCDGGPDTPGIDNDCDGQVDEPDALDAQIWHADEDGDGYGSASSTPACVQPTDYVDNSDDCDDSRADVHPGADEVCDTIDEDCDGQIDEGVTTTYYPDADGDGFGALEGAEETQTVQTCEMPDGYAAVSGDCNDSDPAINPLAEEICDGADAAPLDNNCDGQIDEGVAVATYYIDADGDGFGDPDEDASVVSCARPEGYVADSGDCDDLDAEVNPEAIEVCNAVDDNCNVAVDEGVTTVFYLDADQDGYGDPRATTSACSAPDGYVSGAEDCDDAAVAVYPGADEVCNGIDDNCDGVTDLDAVDRASWYADADGDGYGNENDVVLSCSQPEGTVAADAGFDCDDTEATIHPGATESFYDGIDQDCAGDDDFDADGDGVASATYGGQDCDDTDPSIKTLNCRRIGSLTASRDGWSLVDGTACPVKDFVNDSSNGLEATVVGIEEITDETLAGISLFFLAIDSQGGVWPQLSEAEDEALRTFVDGGGSLIVFFGYGTTDTVGPAFDVNLFQYCRSPGSAVATADMPDAIRHGLYGTVNDVDWDRNCHENITFLEGSQAVVLLDGGAQVEAALIPPAALEVGSGPVLFFSDYYFSYSHYYRTVNAPDDRFEALVKNSLKYALDNAYLLVE